MSKTRYNDIQGETMIDTKRLTAICNKVIDIFEKEKLTDLESDLVLDFLKTSHLILLTKNKTETGERHKVKIE